MGNSSGHHQGGQVINKHDPNQPQAQPPPREPPYPGPSPDYRFINLEISNTAKYSFGGAGQEMMSSNVDSFYPMLSQHYHENFRLLSFYKTPSQTHSGMFNPTIKVPYQAIYYRYPYQNEGWRLQIEKSVLEPRRTYNYSFLSSEGHGMVADSSQLIQAISRHSSQGGRLICMEETGQQVAQGFSGGLQGRLPSIGVDVFFDMPTHPNPQIYTYQIISVPMEVRAGFGGQTVFCDWASHLGQFLCQGWRLVEIFVDNSQVAGRGFSMTAYANTIWFFEKPLSKMNDTTPVYQGTFIDHFVTLHGGFSGVTANCGWEQKILEMASQGWELACILRTPEQRGTGIARAEIKFILFFQRNLVQQSAPNTAYGFESAGAPPPYESVGK
ncbi:hypothetical protein LOTGIDRAFT_228597 [Lottia gigantea]|uniref:Uncharacterized protein n=1 Tax=Lottia gigantea TaxID=225164 RepID=V4AAP6_LOTGI|nr:hypothetical protein LOTGIDRAFT_228597 [Lottia gigantea]ESO93832.1 hypothetical protein LOTGIDRAFT_228597 [Lottia gigantea]